MNKPRFVPIKARKVPIEVKALIRNSPSPFTERGWRRVARCNDRRETIGHYAARVTFMRRKVVVSGWYYAEQK